MPRERPSHGPAGQPLERNTRCDVAIVGGGITGALLAEHLTAMGRDVVLIDREREGFGSTAASTAMLQWEIDLSLRDLAALYGFDLTTLREIAGRIGPSVDEVHTPLDPVPVRRSEAFAPEDPLETLLR